MEDEFSSKAPDRSTLISRRARSRLKHACIGSFQQYVHCSRGFLQAVECAGWHFLAMEDLTDADRAPPWNAKNLTAVLQRLAAFHNTHAEAPASVVDIADELGKANWSGLVAEKGAVSSFCRLFADTSAAEKWLEVSMPSLWDFDRSFPPRTGGPWYALRRALRQHPVSA